MAIVMVSDFIGEGKNMNRSLLMGGLYWYYKFGMTTTDQADCVFYFPICSDLFGHDLNFDYITLITFSTG